MKLRMIDPVGQAGPFRAGHLAGKPDCQIQTSHNRALDQPPFPSLIREGQGGLLSDVAQPCPPFDELRVVSKAEPKGWLANLLL
ncbi:MAG: hypothetical protein WBF13_06600 [Candidatus Zixiibacteriota bacterium]